MSAKTAKRTSKVDRQPLEAFTLNTNVIQTARDTFAKHLLGLMAQKGLSASDLARAAFGQVKDKQRGYKVAAKRHLISKYLNGHAYPTSTIARKLAKALDVSPEELAPPEVSALLNDSPIQLKGFGGEGEPLQYMVILSSAFLKEDAEKIAKLVMDARERWDAFNISRFNKQKGSSREKLA